MVVLPIAGDTIRTSSDEKYTVIEFSNLNEKKKPGVFVQSPIPKETKVIYFADIREINGVEVKLTKDHVFESFGVIRRKFQLPQINDLVRFKPRNDSDDGQLQVTQIKLNNKVGIILQYCDSEKCYPIDHILDTPDGKGFNRKGFLKCYKDYCGMNHESSK